MVMLTKVSKSLGRFSLSDVSFLLERGEVLVIAGNNGSGKSTLIDIISGVANHDKGDLKLFGKSPEVLSREERQKVGVIRDESKLPEDLTVRTFFKSVSILFDRWDSVLMNYLLNKYQIEKKKKIRELSKGMKLKLWIIIALSHKSEILLLDEPFSGLDPTSKSDFIETIKQLKTDGATLAVATHEFELIEEICDKVLLLYEGKMLYYGSYSGLLSFCAGMETRQSKKPFAGTLRLKEAIESILVNREKNAK